jgi:DNA replication and repair protein RecF
MPISKLIVNDFRNLTSANINPSPRINIIHGENGSGKTSLLESIHLLGTNKSFRTSDNPSIIQNSKEQLSVFAEYAVDNAVNKIGIIKQKGGHRKIQVNNSNKPTLALLASILPIQAITINSYKIFHDGPKARREFIDRGLFHVNPQFNDSWKQYQQALKQRNSALKQRKSRAEISNWNAPLIEAGMHIDQLRKDYISDLEPVINKLSTALLPEHPTIYTQYNKGWSEEHSLSEQLHQNIERDRILGYTGNGPHRADLNILTKNKTLIKNHLSQGQLKLTAYALHLAQDRLLKHKTSKNHVLLIDDITAELDSNSLERLCTQVIHNAEQCFITCIDKTLIEKMMPNDKSSVFHMKHGVIDQESGLCG